MRTLLISLIFIGFNVSCKKVDNLEFIIQADVQLDKADKQLSLLLKLNQNKISFMIRLM